MHLSLLPLVLIVLPLVLADNESPAPLTPQQEADAYPPAPSQTVGINNYYPTRLFGYEQVTKSEPTQAPKAKVYAADATIETRHGKPISMRLSTTPTSSSMLTASVGISSGMMPQRWSIWDQML